MSNNFGFVRVASAIPAVEVANCSFNQEQMLALIKKATEEKVQVLCFPELSITSYTCQDLFIQQKLLDDAINRYGFSPRAVSACMKVSRTIADIEGSEAILPSHMSEAISYRKLCCNMVPELEG